MVPLGEQTLSLFYLTPIYLKTGVYNITAADPKAFSWIWAGSEHVHAFLGIVGRIHCILTIPSHLDT